MYMFIYLFMYCIPLGAAVEWVAGRSLQSDMRGRTPSLPTKIIPAKIPCLKTSR